MQHECEREEPPPDVREVMAEHADGDQLADGDQVPLMGLLLHGSDVVIGPDVRPAGRTGHRDHEPKAQGTNELSHSLLPSHDARARGKRRVAPVLVVKERFGYAATAGPTLYASGRAFLRRPAPYVLGTGSNLDSLGGRRESRLQRGGPCEVQGDRTRYVWGAWAR